MISLAMACLTGCSSSTSEGFLRLASDHPAEEGEELEDESQKPKEEDDLDDPQELEWIPGPTVEGEVVLLDGPEPTAVVGAVVSEYGASGETTITDEFGQFVLEVENQNPWRVLATGPENTVPGLWTTTLEAVNVGRLPVVIDLLDLGKNEDIWLVDFELAWGEELGVIIALFWMNGFTESGPEMSGLSIEVDTSGAELWGLNSQDFLVPVDGLQAEASEAELWLVGVPEGNHAFSWTAPPGMECFGPSDVSVLGRTYTWVQMGCRSLE